MSRGKFESLLLPDTGDSGEVWELFHENSKSNRFRPIANDSEVYQTMLRRHPTLQFTHTPTVGLPPPLTTLPMGLIQAMQSRQSARAWPEINQPLTLEAFATLLHCAGGITRKGAETGFGIDLRVAPSGGGLYPIELYVHAREVEGLAPGIYHYDPVAHGVRLLRDGDMAPALSEAFVQREIPYSTTALVFLTALFRRSTFKYRDRGYRFVLLEAGHIAQNLTVVANSLSLPVLSVGGYFDRQLDELLEFDGVNESVVYVVGLGGAPAQ